MSCIKTANKLFYSPPSVARRAGWLTSRLPLFSAAKLSGAAKTRIYGFVSVPIKDPIWLIIVKFMHISSAALCSAHTLDLPETNPAPRVAIKSATYFSCGGVRSRSGWHYNAVQRCGHVKSEPRLRQSWRGNHKAISHPSKSSSEPYSSTVNFNWKSKLLCSRYSLQFLLRYTTLQINFKWSDCSGAHHTTSDQIIFILFSTSFFLLSTPLATAFIYIS